MTQQRMQGRVALVSGGTQGVGEAVARRLAAEGAAGVAVCGRNEARGEAVRTAIAALGCEALYVRADLSVVADCVAAVERTVARFGRLDALANCAGRTDRGGLADTTEQSWGTLFDTNVRGPFFLIQGAAAQMQRQGQGQGGSMVVIGSMQAYGGAPFLLPYAATKGCLMTLTRGIANTLLRDRIRINMLNIGWTDTPNEHVVQTQVHGRGEDWRAEVGRLQPYGRLISTDEVAAACAFLLSPESGMMSGAVIDYDQQVIGPMQDNPGV